MSERLSRILSTEAQTKPETTQSDTRKKIVERQAIELVRSTILEQDIKREELPDILDIDSELLRISQYEDKQATVYEALMQMRDLSRETGYEFGREVVSDYKGKMEFGPLCCDEDTHSVRINSPKKEHEYTLPSGLIAIRHDTAPIIMHCHPGTEPFSLQDIFVHFGRDCKQMYVVRENGDIDMLQRTDQSRLMGKEAFERLIALWDTYLTPTGQLRPDLTEEEHHAFFKRISTSQLELGFYTNAGGGARGKLKLVK